MNELKLNFQTAKLIAETVNSINVSRMDFTKNRELVRIYRESDLEDEERSDMIALYESKVSYAERNEQYFGAKLRGILDLLDVHEIYVEFTSGTHYLNGSPYNVQLIHRFNFSRPGAEAVNQEINDYIGDMYLWPEFGEVHITTKSLYF